MNVTSFFFYISSWRHGHGKIGEFVTLGPPLKPLSTAVKIYGKNFELYEVFALLSFTEPLSHPVKENLSSIQKHMECVNMDCVLLRKGTVYNVLITAHGLFGSFLKYFVIVPFCSIFMILELERPDDVDGETGSVFGDIGSGFTSTLSISNFPPPPPSLCFR